jgi:hypothetical protein
VAASIRKIPHFAMAHIPNWRINSEKAIILLASSLGIFIKLQSGKFSDNILKLFSK